MQCESRLNREIQPFVVEDVHRKSRLRGYKNRYVGSPILQYLILPLFFGVLGARMTFKKAEMAKTLRNGLSMIETNPLNHNWWDFAIKSGLALHQFQKKLLLRVQSKEKFQNSPHHCLETRKKGIDISYLIS